MGVSKGLQPGDVPLQVARQREGPGSWRNPIFWKDYRHAISVLVLPARCALKRLLKLSRTEGFSVKNLAKQYPKKTCFQTTQKSKVPLSLSLSLSRPGPLNAPVLPVRWVWEKASHAAGSWNGEHLLSVPHLWFPTGGACRLTDLVGLWAGCRHRLRFAIHAKQKIALIGNFTNMISVDFRRCHP